MIRERSIDLHFMRTEEIVRTKCRTHTEEIGDLRCDPLLTKLKKEWWPRVSTKKSKQGKKQQLTDEI